MGTLDYRTAGESHGRALIALVEGMPADVAINLDFINREFRRRQGGYGRGGRMKIEQDQATILSGLRRGRTIGSPIALQIENRDVRIDEALPVHRPRPGHADLAGSLKWLTTDCRSILERASARETAARVAAGALVRSLLCEFQIDVIGYVVQIGATRAAVPPVRSADSPVYGSMPPGRAARGDVRSCNEPQAQARRSSPATPAPSTSETALPNAAPSGIGTAPCPGTPDALRAARDANDVFCPDPSAVDAMIAEIRRAMMDKDTLGGVVEVVATGLPPGLGSCMRWQDKLDGRLMAAVGSIQAIKGVEIGLGFESAGMRGSAVHDAILFDAAARDTHTLGFVRASNHAGGLEGGMTNGQPLVVRAAMKPISTLLQGMDSVNLMTRAPERSDYERSDICAVPAASVVAENVVAFELARALLEKFPSDTVGELRAAYTAYLSAARALGR